MSSPGYARPLRLEPRPSTRLRLLTVAAYCAAFLSATTLPLWSWPIVASGLWLHGRHSWRRHPTLGGAPVVLVWDGEGRWFWQEGGRTEELLLQRDSYRTASLVILNFCRPERRWWSRSLVLPRESLDAVTFRRLKVRLGIEGVEEEAPEPEGSPLGWAIRRLRRAISG